MRIDIGEWFDFQQTGEYFIRGIFFPNLITNAKNRIYSEEELFLNLRPALPEEVVRREEIEKLKQTHPQKKILRFLFLIFGSVVILIGILVFFSGFDFGIMIDDVNFSFAINNHFSILSEIKRFS